MKFIHKLFTLILLSFFVGGMFVSLFNLSSMMSMEMDKSVTMSHHQPFGMNDCPFMTHGEAFCPMSFFDHIVAWKETFVAVVPVLFWLSGLVLVLVIYNLAPNLVLPKKYFLLILQRPLRERVYTHCYRSWQDFFAQGILNPKLF